MAAARGQSWVSPARVQACLKVPTCKRVFSERLANQQLPPSALEREDEGAIERCRIGQVWGGCGKG